MVSINPYDRFKSLIVDEKNNIDEAKKNALLKKLDPELRKDLMEVFKSATQGISANLEPENVARLNTAMAAIDVSTQPPRSGPWERIKKGLSNRLGGRTSSADLKEEFQMAQWMEKGRLFLNSSSKSHALKVESRNSLFQAAQARNREAYFELYRLEKTAENGKELDPKSINKALRYLDKGVMWGEPNCQVEMARLIMPEHDYEYGIVLLFKAQKKLSPEKFEEKVIEIWREKGLTEEHTEGKYVADNKESYIQLLKDSLADELARMLGKSRAECVKKAKEQVQ